jgi:hypothetical protein
MKIDNYNLMSVAESTYTRVVTTKASLVSERIIEVTLPQEDPKDTLSLASKEEEQNPWKQLWEQSALSSKAPVNLTPKNSFPTNIGDLKSLLLQYLMESFFGIKHKKFEPQQQEKQWNLDSTFSLNLPQMRAYDRITASVQVEYYESETLTYQSKGIVNTADGKSIQIDIGFSMSRELYASMKTETTFEQAVCDPLVINYGGTAASLTDETFQFDLTLDGKKDNIHFASQGSGFLALDVNGDGKINDGSELFGPTTGSGFSELRAHDTDKNGWIDENDAVFNKLVIWSKNSDGTDTLYTLKDLGIGAIYLGDVATSFHLQSSEDKTVGQMQATSFFLKEDGGAGTISHIDLVV